MIQSNESGFSNSQKKYEDNPKKCLFCDQIIPYEKHKNKFCNTLCATSCNNLGAFTNQSTDLFEMKDCLNCGIKTPNKRFCSQSCSSSYRWKKTCFQIELNGALIPTKDINYGYTPTIAKKYLREKRGAYCSICLIDKWLGEDISLVLDHIDGDPYNHKLENIRLICGNCNMLLPTFSGRNKGKGRKSRLSERDVKEVS